MDPTYFVPPSDGYGSPEWKAIQIQRLEDYRQRLCLFSSATAGVIREAFPSVQPETVITFEDALDGILTFNLLQQRQEVERVQPVPQYDPDAGLADLMDERENLANQIENIESILKAQTAQVSEVAGLSALFEVMEQVALAPLRTKLTKIDAMIGRSHLNESVNKTLTSSEGEDPMYPQRYPASQLMPDTLEEFRRRQDLTVEPCPYCGNTKGSHRVTECEQRPLERNGIGEV
jgi:hypothetical protein